MGIKRVVGLDIGTEYLKAVEIERRPEGFRVVRSGLHKLPIGVEKEGLTGDELRVLWIKGRFSKREVATNLQFPEIAVKRIVTERNLSPDRMRWEVEVYLPFNSSSVIIDTYIINPSISPRYQELILVAAPKKIVNNRMELLKRAGLITSSITPSSIALSNLLEVTHPELKKALIIHIGFKNTLFIACKDKGPVLVHSIPFGIKDVISIIQKKEDVDYLTAWEKIREDTPSIKIGSRRLSSRIEEAHSFLPEPFQEAKVFLSGGGALINGFTQNLNIGAEALKFENLSPIYNVGIGLGIGAFYD